MTIVTFVLLMLLWVLLSGQLDAFHLILGVISALVVAVFTSSFIFHDMERPMKSRVAEFGRALLYLLWLIKEIVVANFHVLRMAVHPRLTKVLDPQVKRFRTGLTSDFARYVFANSITLTPGTVTIQVNGDEFVVYAISRKMADSLPGEMERRIQLAFEPQGTR